MVYHAVHEACGRAGGEKQSGGNTARKANAPTGDNTPRGEIRDERLETLLRGFPTTYELSMGRQLDKVYRRSGLTCDS